jgi:hypothetical protein
MLKKKTALDLDTIYTLVDVMPTYQMEKQVGMLI